MPSPLDVAAAAFGQTGQTFVLRIQVRGPLPSKALAAGNGRSLCLVVEQRRPVRDQRLCLAVSRTGRLGLVESHRGADGVYVAPHAIAAHVRRTAADTLLATFTPAAARLTHGRVVWHMSSEWADDAACPAPAAGAVAVCTDRCRTAADSPCGCTGGTWSGAFRRAHRSARSARAARAGWR